jgi:periplasmic protein TonB
MRLQKLTRKGSVSDRSLVTVIFVLAFLVQSCAPRRVQVSPAVLQANLDQQTRAIYPLEARQKRIQGDVVLEATVGKTGLVEDLRVISGPEILRQAAFDAVKSWRYRPVLVNGEPARVTTTITASFRFQ